jgi:hypothetical protein
MDLDSRDDIVHYRNLNYTRKIPNENELKDFDDGVIFIVYGFEYIERYPIRLDILNIVVNSFPHNIYRVGRALLNASSEHTEIKVIVRDAITIDDVDRVRDSIASEINPVRTMYLYYDINDYVNALKCQISQVVRFRKISSGMKNIVMTEIVNILPGIKPSIIRKAVCKARKGDRCR